MKMKTAILGALASTLLLIVPAHGGEAPPPPTLVDTIEGLNGLVNVEEYQYDEFWYPYGQVGYAIDVIGSASVSIDFFAVSNQEPFGEFVSTRTGWGPNPPQPVLSAAQWNSQHGAFGTFSSLFGTNDTHVSVFQGSPAITSDTGIQFFLIGAPSTEFIVAGGGTIIDRSLPGAVPDGGTTFLLLGTALCGLFLGAKKLNCETGTRPY